jgi:hypothetical protein
MTSYRGQQLLNGVINLIPGVLLGVGLIGGIALGAWQYRFGSPLIRAWVAANGGWELSAFGAFGTMSGFGMAALALIATLSAHERGKEAVDSNSGRQMVSFIVRSTWAWLVPGLLALVHILLPTCLVLSLLVGACWFAMTQGVLALLGLTFFFRRFTVTKPS